MAKTRPPELDVKERSRALIPNLRAWPRWPILPMKRPRADAVWPDMGFLYADWATDQDGVRLFLCDIYQYASMTAEGRKQVEVIEFKTVAELLDAGWIVD